MKRAGTVIARGAGTVIARTDADQRVSAASSAPLARGALILAPGSRHAAFCSAVASGRARRGFPVCTEPYLTT